jgi:hypothetical protein
MRKSSVMPTRRSEVEVIDANADEWLLAGASGITVSFRPAIPRQVAPQQSPLPLRRHAQCSVPAATAKGAERKRGACGNFVLDNESPIQGLG